MATNNKLQVYGNAKEINELATRLISSMQGSKNLSADQAMTLAQISIAHGLDPFNGEAWFIPGSGVMVGIKGLRKKARRQLKKESGNLAHYWVQFYREPQPTKYLADPEDIVYVCELRDSETMGAWIKTLEKMKALGLSIADAKAASGDPPITIGVGVVKKGERSMMPKGQLAMKRAEAHAIKQRFDVEFELLEDDTLYQPSPTQNQLEGYSDDESDWIEGEIQEEPQEEPESDRPALRPYTAHFLRAKISDLAGERNALKVQSKTGDREIIEGALAGIFSKQEDQDLLLGWLVGEPDIAKLNEGQVIALKRWLEVEDPSHVPADYIQEEAVFAFEEAIKEQADQKES